jgi:hypothetical protein
VATVCAQTETVLWQNQKQRDTITQHDTFQIIQHKALCAHERIDIAKQRLPRIQRLELHFHLCCSALVSEQTKYNTATEASTPTSTDRRMDLAPISTARSMPYRVHSLRTTPPPASGVHLNIDLQEINRRDAAGPCTLLGCPRIKRGGLHRQRALHRKHGIQHMAARRKLHVGR